MIRLISNDDTRADEPHPGHDALDNAAHGIGVEQAMSCVNRCEHKRSGARRYKTKRPETGGLLVGIATETNCPTDEGGCTETRSDVEPGKHKYHPHREL